RDLAVRNEQADRWHDVIDCDRGHAQVGDGEFLAEAERYVLHDGAAVIAQLSKPRIDIVVENIALQKIDNLLRCVDADRLFQLAEEFVNEYRQAGNMIHMRMRDDDIADGSALRFSRRNTNTTGVDGDAGVNNETRQPLRRINATMGIERAG